MSSAVRPALFVSLAIVFMTAEVALLTRGEFRHGSFKAFYCAGRVLNAGQDPYRAEPLGTCERHVSADSLPGGDVEPAPLPGYVLLPLRALGALPFNAAAAVFCLASIAATISAAWLLSLLSKAPSAATLLVLLPLAHLNLNLGEFPVFTTLAICVAAYALEAQRWALAAVSAALSLVQPHLGLPVVVSLFLFAPDCRKWLAASVAALALLALAGNGITGNIEYLRYVLPEMARAELPAGDQFSLSHALFAAGTPALLALRLGELSYALMLAVSIAVARLVAIRMRRPAVLVCLSAVGVLLGGVFVHDIQMAAALPAAVLVAASLPSRRRISGFVLLTLLALVWTERAAPLIVAVNAGAIFGAAALALKANVRVRALEVTATAVSAIGVLLAVQHFEPPVRSTAIHTSSFSAAPSEYAPVVWGRYLRATPAREQPEFLHHVPTWIGLVLLLSLSTVSVAAGDTTEEAGLQPALVAVEPS